MNVDFLKNPVYAGAAGFILTILYIYLKNLSSEKEVNTNEYFMTSGYVGLICGALIHLTQKEGVFKKVVQEASSVLKVNTGMPDF